MPTLPAPMIAVLRAFAPLFSARVWDHAQVLLVGALLAPAQRTVAAALRVTEHAQVRPFHRYHRVLSHFVKASGLRWVCLMLLVPIPWAARTWALPVLTALAPSERHDGERGRGHKTLTDWARQLLLVVRRWWPECAIVAVADSTYAALEFLAACRAWCTPV